MRKTISYAICLALLISIFPLNVVFAYDIPNEMGLIASGQQHTGILSVNGGGNSIPDEYDLIVPQNSIIRLSALRQSVSYFIEVDSLDNPYAATETYTTIKGSDTTQIFESASYPGPQAFYSSCFGLTSYSDNPSTYTEIFSNLIAGNYKLRIRGGKDYSFKVDINPLKYTDDNPLISNETIETAKAININQNYQGNMMSNGIINHQFFENKYDFYSFEVTSAGKYILDLSTDGFFQGQATILDSNSYSVSDASIEASIFFEPSNQFAATYEQHITVAKTFTRSFNIDKAGRYYLKISKTNFTAGSYAFTIKSVSANKITPKSTIIKIIKGKIAKNMITAEYSDGTKKDVTKQVKLTSSSKNVTIYKSYSFKAVKKGTAIITVSFKGLKTKYKVIVK